MKKLVTAKSFVSVGWQVGIARGQLLALSANEKCWAVHPRPGRSFGLLLAILQTSGYHFGPVQQASASIEDAFKQKKVIAECWCKIRSMEKRG
jgi:hypothetical protein